MKKMLAQIPVVIMLSVLLLGCEKNEISYGESENVTENQALLKFNFESAYALNPPIQISLNGKRVSGLLATRTPWPGGGYNTLGNSFPDYLAVASGDTKLTIGIPNRGLSTDSVVLYSTTIKLEAGKYYTSHITDTAANTQGVLATDETTKPDSGFAKLKFVNLMPNVAAIDLYYGTTVVAAAVPYKGISGYFNVPVLSTSLAWTIRAAGSSATSTALATYTSASTTANQRILTAFATGYSGSTDAVRRPYISFLLNR